MFIAMNRLRVAKGSEAAFEHVWMSRDSHLDKVPGFVEFHLLKGSEAECLVRGEVESDELFVILERWPDLEGPAMWTNENRARYDRSHL